MAGKQEQGMGGWTKGPWKVAHRGFKRLPCITASKDGRPFSVATVTTEEDARLIAAAPDLFEQLTIALAVIDKSGIIWMGEGRARDALSKALPK